MFEFKLPDLGEGIHEGELLKWHLNPGDHVNEDDSLCDMETDKATVTIPSPRTGTIVQLNGNPGDIITVGTVLVVIEEQGSGQAKESVQKPKAEPEKPSPAAAEPDPGASGPGADPEDPAETGAEEKDRPVKRQKSGKKAIAAPAVRRLAREMGIDINQVTGTGPAGRVIRQDLENASPAPAAAESTAFSETDSLESAGIIGTAVGGIPFLEVEPLPDYAGVGPVDIIPVRSLRRKVAAKTVTSMILVPHVAHMDEIDVTDLEAMRKSYNDRPFEDIKLTLLPFVMKTAASLLRRYPQFNASLDAAAMQIIHKKFYHIGFAANTPKGLIVPVVRDTEQKSVMQIANEVAQLAQKGKDGSITVPELTGGTFTITNVGAIGGTGAVPTINYPECAILAMGRVNKKPVVKDDAVVIRKILPVTLCFDHRIADGAQAALFINELKRMLENPVEFMTGI